MAIINTNLKVPEWMNRLASYSSLLAPIAIVSLMGVIIVPLSPVVLDLLITANIAIASIVLVTTIYIDSPLKFASFPSLLLATTLFRLVLNVASTRLILSADATSPAEAVDLAGKVIQAFGEFVAGGSLVVGFVIFILLIIVQFVVITKGATRISEVAARFTLDGMPGKQMAIDADLNAGAINEAEARKRREEITKQADFYGAMDGASKFVRGDAIAGIIITIVNVAGGIMVGMLEKDWTLAQSVSIFTRLTIGDGLVSQMPSFILSLAAALIVTRSSDNKDLGSELMEQLTGQSVALYMTSGLLTVLAFTGLPMAPMLLMASLIAMVAFFTQQSAKEEDDAVKAAEEAKTAKAAAEQPIEKLLQVDTLELEVGYGLVRLVDAGQGGDLLERIKMIRRQLAMDLGMVVPPVRIRDNMQLQPHEYHIKVRGSSVARGEVFPGQFLAMDSGLAEGPLEGERTREPAFGLDAWWIDPAHKSRAEMFNYTVVDASSVLATHLTEVIKGHASELLTREETNNLIEQLREKSPKLIEEVIPDVIKPGDLQKVLQNLLRERVPVRDLETVIETLSDWAPRTKDMDVLTEYVRNALRRTICNQYIENDQETGTNRIYCVTLDPSVEDLVNGYIERSTYGTAMSMPPAVANKVAASIVQQLQSVIAAGHQPVVLTSPPVRGSVKQLLDPHMSNAAVLGYNEISKGIEVESMGLVQLEPATATQP